MSCCTQIVCRDTALDVDVLSRYDADTDTTNRYVLPGFTVWAGNLADLECGSSSTAGVYVHEWAIDQFIVGASVPPVLNFVDSGITHVGAVADVGPAGGVEVWEVLVNGVQVTTVTLAAGTTTSGVVVFVSPLAAGDVITAQPLSTTATTSSTGSTLLIRIEES